MALIQIEVMASGRYSAQTRNPSGELVHRADGIDFVVYAQRLTVTRVSMGVE